MQEAGELGVVGFEALTQIFIVANGRKLSDERGTAVLVVVILIERIIVRPPGPMRAGRWQRRGDKPLWGGEQKPLRGVQGQRMITNDVGDELVKRPFVLA